MKQSRASSVLGKAYVGILLVIFGGIVLHAPFSVGLSTLWPDYELVIKSWKEILMLCAGLLALVLLYKNRQMRILKEPILIAVEVYATLHLVLLAWRPQGWGPSLAGLAVDLRYVLFFSLVYMALKLYPGYRKIFISVGMVGALVVAIFAMMQVFILPKDILKYLGYDANTISPYLTIDKNDLFIRINSTLRGPNPLGAYAGLVLALVVAAVSNNKVRKGKWPLFAVAVLSLGSLTALWFSYSRSALIGSLVAMAVVLLVVFYKKMSAKLFVSLAVLVLVIGGGLFLARGTMFVSNVLLHNNLKGGSIVKSDEGHVNSLNSGLNQLVNQPLGAGVGSTGAASLLGSNPEVIENQYLLIAHEVGWLGLAVFMYIFVVIMNKLWCRRKDWLALGVFASGVSVAFIGVFLPVLVDDTVSIIWWGLAAIALSQPTTNNKEWYN